MTCIYRIQNDVPARILTYRPDETMEGVAPICARLTHDNVMLRRVCVWRNCHFIFVARYRVGMSKDKSLRFSCIHSPLEKGRVGGIVRQKKYMVTNPFSSLADRKGFSAELLNELALHDFGSFTKNDYEVLLFYLLLNDKNYSKLSNFDLSCKLRVTETKIRKLAYEASVKYGQNDTEDSLREKARKVFLRRTIARQTIV